MRVEILEPWLLRFCRPPRLCILPRFLHGANLICSLRVFLHFDLILLAKFQNAWTKTIKTTNFSYSCSITQLITSSLQQNFHRWRFSASSWASSRQTEQKEVWTLYPCSSFSPSFYPWISSTTCHLWFHPPCSTLKEKSNESTVGPRVSYIVQPP